MFKIKYVKHLSIIVLCVIILFTSSLSAFAESTGSFKFIDCSDVAFSYWADKDGDGKKELYDCNNLVTSYYHSSYNFGGVLYPCSEYDYDKSLGGYTKMFNFIFPLQFVSGAEYTVNFNYAFNISTVTNLTFFLVYSFFDGSSSENVVLYQTEDANTYNWHNVNCSFQVPTFNKSFTVSFMILTTTSSVTSEGYRQIFWFSDMNITKPDDFQGPPIDDSASEQIDDINNQISSIEGELPKIDADELDGLINGVNIDEYNNGFRAFNRVFDDVITALDMQAVLIFCLSFGLAIYIIGRRLRA